MGDTITRIAVVVAGALLGGLVADVCLRNGHAPIVHIDDGRIGFHCPLDTDEGAEKDGDA